MPLQQVTIRRGSFALMVAFAVALAAVVTAVVVWQIRPAENFVPLSIPDRLFLTNGDGNPPRIASGQPIKFNPTTWCNSLDHAASVHITITLINADTPAIMPVAVLAGLPATVAKGCTGSHNLTLSLPDPIKPGTWKLALTISVVDAGRAQSLSLLSEPFVVTGSP